MSNFPQNVPNHGFWNFNFLIFISKKKGNWELLFIWMPALKFTEWSKKINGHMFNTKLEQSHIKSASKLYRLKYSGQKTDWGHIVSSTPGADEDKVEKLRITLSQFWRSYIDCKERSTVKVIKRKSRWKCQKAKDEHIDNLTL